ncbi:hydroxyacid dehydrogenase [Bordetella petrii]|uniref:Hydroxyacid dehydrogenase n=1 Tax=Bordetella petrii TaxID=94624 RepID=A0ABT7W6D8_9BORD|nr:hydroxyacid dehydrogenase [Bordetella petrii]MDM9560735.1 hydroxyacid dehydrogenase [Bordetella petrii]
MTSTPKKVVRLNLWTDPSFDRILRADPNIALTVLDLAGPEQALWDQLGQADVYHVSAAKDEVPPQWQVTRALLERCPRLLCASTSGAGYDTVDVQACTERGVLVVNQAGGNAASVAEHAFGLMLAVARRIVESDQRLKAGGRFSREDLMGHELNGQTLGLVGIGHIGRRAARLGQAFGMRVLAHDPYLDDAEVRARGAEPVPLDELLASSDVVSLHCPRTAQTEGLFDAAAFRAMKRGALFISTARGGIHDEAALHDALAAGNLGGAGLDVWKVEPPPPSHPLLGLWNVVSTFHTGGVTHEGRRNVATMAAEQIRALCAGDRPGRIVNDAAWPAFTARLRA